MLLKIVWILIEQSVMASGTVYVFMGFVIGQVQLSLLIMWGVPIGAVGTSGHLFIFLILLKIG